MTNESFAMTPRMPRQAPGVVRGATGQAALRAAAGVEAAGILEFFFGDEVGGAIGDVVDVFVPGIHHLADKIYEAV